MLTEKQIEQYGTRKHQTFHNLRGQPVTAFETQEPGCWWVPEERHSVWLGKHIFESKAEAIDARRLHLQSEIKRLQAELDTAKADLDTLHGR